MPYRTLFPAFHGKSLPSLHGPPGLKAWRAHRFRYAFLFTLLSGALAAAEPNYYQLVLEQVSWDEAVEICENRGGNLATITSEEEWNVIHAKLGDALKGLDIWLGGRRLSPDDDNWLWVTGEPWGAPRAVYQRWRPDEPDGNYGQQDRLFINGSHSRHGPNLLWNDHPNNYDERAFSRYIIKGYIAEFGRATVSGSVAYSGEKTGALRVSLTGGPDDEPGGSLELDGPGNFNFSDVVIGWEYTLYAFIDENGDGIKDRTEPQGKYIYSPHLLTQDLTDIQLQVFDQNNPPDSIRLSSLNIPAQAPLHSTIGQITATDPDAGQYPIVYVVSPKDKFLVQGNKLVTSTTFSTDVLEHSVTLRAVDEGGLTLDKTFQLRVVVGNQPPTVSTIDSITIAEDGFVELSNTGPNAISLSDDAGNSDTVEFTLSASEGTFHFYQSNGLEFTDGANGEGFMTVSGTLSTIRSRLSRLKYKPPQDYNGSAKLTLLLNDLGKPGSEIADSLVDLHTVSVTITAVNDAPFLFVPADKQILDENTLTFFSTLGGNGISVRDDPEHSNRVEVTLTTANGDITLGNLDGLFFQEGDGLEDQRIRVHGDTKSLNLALEGLIYKPTPDFSGETTIRIAVDDLGNIGDGPAGATQAEIRIQVIAKNDAPSIQGPNAATLAEDSPLQFHADAQNAITVHDDASSTDAVIQASLSVGMGSLVFANTEGLSFPVGDSQGDSEIVVTGKYSVLSLALQDFTYTPDANYFGEDSLHITINDKGHHGDGGEKTTEHTIGLTITPVNDVPHSIHLSGNSVEEGKSGVVIGSLSAEDIDAGDSHTFKLLSGTREFSLTGTTLKTASALDFLRKPLHQIKIEVQDAAGAKYSQTFTIRVINSNDAPDGLSLTGGGLQENKGAGTYVGTLRTSDPDGTLGRGLVGYWPFDEATGTSTADITSNENQATFKNMGDTPWTDGKYAGGLKFNGFGHVIIPNIQQYLVDEGTISLWYNQSSSTGTVFSKDATGFVTGGHVNIRMKSNILESRLQSTTQSYTVKAPNSSGNSAFQWHHAVLQFGEQGHVLYLDGVKVAHNPDYTGGIGSSSGGVGNNEPIAIGASASVSNTFSTEPASEHFKGTIDDFRIYNRILAEDEIQELTTANFPSFDYHNFELLSSTDLFAIDGDILQLKAPLNFEENSLYTVRVKTTDSGGLSHTETLTIQVEDINDAPTGLNLSAASIAENLPNGTLIGTFSATDEDTNSADSIKVGQWAFSHLPNRGRDAEYFPQSVQEFAGATFQEFIPDTAYLVHSLQNPDDLVGEGYYVYETWIEANKDMELPVAVWGDAGHSLFLDDEFIAGGGFGRRENAVIELAAKTPRKFTAVVYQARNTVFVHVTSNLRKISDASGLSISSGGQRHVFKLVEGEGSKDNILYQIVDGQLQSAAPFDYEKSATHSIRVQVNDSGLVFEKAFTISITDANDAPNGISPEGFTIVENSAKGTNVGSLSVSDPDEGDQHTFLVITPDDGPPSLFSVQGKQLLVNGSLDFEAQAVHTVKLSVFDKANASHTQEITVTLTDANEAPTGILLPDAKVKENQNANTIVGTLAAIDPDAGDSGHTFTITGGEHAGNFTIEGNQVRTTRPLDFEAAPVQTFLIEATDKRGLSTIREVSVTILDLNDAPTGILLDNNVILENKTAGTLIGNLSAVDPDQVVEGQPGHRFRLVEGEGAADNALFSIEGNQLQSSAPLDYELQAEYNIAVEVADPGGLTYTTLFTIHAEDAADAPTGIELDNASIAENQRLGSLVGNLSAADQDSNDTHTYEILDEEGSDAEFFKINRSQLNTASQLNFEDRQEYSVKLRVTDNAGLSFTQSFKIQVTDVNEAPDGATLVPNTILENEPAESLAGILVPSDPDNGDTHTFKIVGGTDQTAFRLDGKQLLSTRSFDFESKPTLSISIEVKDAKGLTSEVRLTVNVADANDPPTDILLDKDTFPENQRVGTHVAILSAVDQDTTGDTGPSFALVDGDGDKDNALYSIEGNQLRVAAAHNFETAPVHSIRVRATDADNQVFEKTLQLTLKDAPDAPTAISLRPALLKENLPAGTEVGILSVEDEDGVDRHIFQLVGADGDFSLRGNVLSSARAFDFETEGEYRLKVKVTDKASLVLTQNLTITIQDANDAPTGLEIDQDKVAESLPAGSLVGTLVASDPDAGDSHIFRVIGGEPAGFFKIEGNQLLTAAILDRETHTSASVTLQAMDKAKATFDRTFEITIVDVNDAPTNILLDNDTLPENEPEGTTVGNLSLVDPDQANDPDATPKATFELVEGTGSSGNRWFQIEGAELKIAIPLDYESKVRYPIRIKAIDEGGLSVERNFQVTATDAPDAPHLILIDKNGLPENEPKGKAIGTLSAKDQDARDKHTFAMPRTLPAEPNDNKLFYIRDGILYSNATVNYDETRELTVFVEATDLSKLTFVQALTIKVIDTNDPPTDILIDNDHFPEDTPRRSLVGTLSAVDPDATDTHRFQLLKGKDGDGFYIRGDELYTNRTFDFETEDTLEILVRVTDAGRETLDVGLQLRLTDAPDAPIGIVIDNDTIPESEPPGTFVGVFSMLDPDIDSIDGPQERDHNLSIGVGGNAAQGLLGQSVSIHGKVLAVGAPGEGEGKVPASGAVYLYSIAGDGVLSDPVRIVPETPQQDARFGWSVFLDDGVLLVGAPSHDLDKVEDVGAVHIYEVDMVTLEVTSRAIFFESQTDEGDAFGFSIEKRGSVVAIGAPDADTNGIKYSGATYVYDLNPGFTLIEKQKLTAPVPARNDSYGMGIKMSASNLVISANRSSPQGQTAAGAVHLYGFDRDGQFVHKQQVLAPEVSGGDSFGNAIALSDGLLVVGAHYADPDGVERGGLVHLYGLSRNVAKFIQTLSRENPEKDDRFGETLALRGDLLLVGSERTDDGRTEDVGSVEVFRLVGGNHAKHILEYKLPSPTPGAFLGSSLALGENFLAIGASKTNGSKLENAGAVYVKEIPGPDPYSLVSGFGDSENEFFTIKWDTLQIRKPLDFEIQEEYSIRVRATDETGLHFDQQLFIRTTDAPDAPYNLALDNSSILENMRSGTPVGKLSVEDQDARDRHTFHLATDPEGGENDNALFELRKNQLRSAASFDFETNPSYTIHIEARDSAGLSHIRAFEIEVLDQNDPPTGLDIDNSTIAENLPPFTLIGKINGIDPDPKERFLYSIIGGKDRGAVTLKGNQVKSSKTFDYETQQELDLIIRVTDSQKAIADVPLTIRILDQNDAPHALHLGKNSLPENSGNDSVVGTLASEDVDNEFRTGARFSLVTLKHCNWDTALADAESNGGYLATFTSQAEWDSMLALVGKENLANKKFWIGGSDAREEGKWEWVTGETWVWDWWLDGQPSATDIQDPKTGEWNRENYLQIKGNSSPDELRWNDTLADQFLNGYILENEVFLFSLVPGDGDDDNDAFRIDGNKLRILNDPNFEAKDKYSVRIEATDPYGATFSQSFVITITDVPETPFLPIISRQAVDENMEADTQVGRVTANDPDFRDSVVVTLAEDNDEVDNELFYIKKGILYTTSPLDHETQGLLALRLVATDKTGLQTIDDFGIHVSDINEPPVGLLSDVDSILENPTVGVTLATITPQDPDRNDNFLYSLATGLGDKDNHLFLLDPNTGILTIAPGANLDFETKLFATIRVAVTDSAKNKFEGMLSFDIRDTNETPDSVTLDNGAVMEGLPKGTLVGKLSATDPDADNSHSFSLVAGDGDDDNKLFQIRNSELKTTATLSTRNQVTASIRVKAVDQDGASYEEILTIQVLNAPDAPDGVTIDNNTIERYQPSGTYIGTLTSHDVDPGDTHTFALAHYGKGNSNELFYIRGDQLLSNHVFGDDALSTYKILVRVTDSAGLTNETELTIKVIKATKPDGYLLQVTKNPPHGGLVTGAGFYKKGETATLDVQGSLGYQFAGHSGDIPGGFSAENPLSLVIESETNVTTNFTPSYHKVTVGVHPPQHGYAWGGGNILQGTEITVNALELDDSYGVTFTHWTINNEIHQLDPRKPNQLTFTVTHETEVLAHFDYGIHDTMTHIPAGTFTQGNDRYRTGPTNQPFINAFYVDKYETTKALWYEVYNWAVRNGYEFRMIPDEPYGRNMAHTDRAYKDDMPITGLVWDDPVKWCNARSEMLGLEPVYYMDAEKTEVFRTGGARGGFEPTNDMVKWDAKGYRLPTEAEWEKAARGGVDGLIYPNGNTLDDTTAHFNQRTKTRSIKPVGERLPNGYGLYDCAGNAWEMCWDWYWRHYYKHNFDLQAKDPNFVLANPRGPYLEQVGRDNWKLRVARGGSGNSNSHHTRVYFRKEVHKTWMMYAISFRSVVPAPNEPFINLEVGTRPAHLGAAKGSGTYPVGESVAVEADPVDGKAKFLHWEDGDGNILGKKLKHTLDPLSNMRVVAVFEDISPDAEKLFSLQLSANPSGSGLVIGGGAYLKGTEVTISAIPSGENDFAGWAGDTTGLQATMKVKMDGHKTITGYFGDTSLDNDGDGLSDIYETFIGANPFFRDSDGDGIPDDEEVNLHSSNPASRDSDNDGHDDRSEVFHKTRLNDPNDFPFMPEDSLVRHFTFRSARLNDYSRNRVKATGKGYSGIFDRNKVNSQAIAFHGNGTQMTVTKYPGVKGSGAFAVSGWILTETVSDAGIFSWGFTGKGFEINVSAGVLQIVLGQTTLTGSTVVQDNTWHQFLVSLPEGGTPGDLKVWINGIPEELVSTGDISSPVNTVTKSNATIGDTPSGQNYTGRLDDIRIWDRALVGSEAAKLYDLERYVEPDTIRPEIIEHPLDVTVAEGSGASFTVKANGKPAPTYTWQQLKGRKWYNLRGNGATLALDGLEVDDSSIIRVTVSNSVGKVSSRTARLTVMALPEFTTKPTDVYMLKTRPGFMDVAVTGSPRLTYEWFRNGLSLGSTLKNRFQFPRGATQASHGGTYTVTVSNDVGQATSQPFQVEFVDAVEITVQPEDTGILAGKSGSIFLEAIGGGKIRYQWWRYDSKRRQYLEIAGGTGPQLPFDNMTIRDEGVYYCVVTNGPSQVISTKVDVTLLEAPSFRIQPRSLQVNEFGNISIKTLAQGIPEPTYQWKKYDPEQGDWIDIPKIIQPTLSLKRVSREASGSYRVVATNAGGTATSVDVEITVYYAPTITQDLAPVVANEGGSLVLSIEAVALDQKGTSMTYQWMFNNKKLTDRGGITGSRTPSLTIDPLTLDHEGVYSCSLRNAVGITNTKALKLYLVRKPYAAKPMKDLTLAEGKNATFVASLRGSKPMTLQWQKDGKDIKGATITKLVLRAVKPADSGTYSVVASNSAGTFTMSAVLTVDAASKSSPVPGGDAKFLTATELKSPDLDSDGDGLSNLLEHALGSDPVRHDSTFAPEISSVEGPDGEVFVSFSYTENKTVSGITYLVEASQDLNDWVPSNANGGAVTKIDRGDYSEVTYFFPADSSNRFFRVRIEE